MEKTEKKRTLYLALLVAFIDFFGVGLVYPLFSSMLFDTTYPLLPPETSATVRGVWLGFLLAAMPLLQFFSAPLWGALSDSKGRRNPLLQSMGLALFSYFVAIFGVWINNIFLLLFSRILVGIASGNTSIVQAAVSDLSETEEKGKHFGLYSMALGIGFSLGPFLGGILSAYGYSVPFLFATFIIAINLIFSFLFFKESNTSISKKKIHPFIALTQLTKAFNFPKLRTILVASFFFNFGWSYFFEFAPVFLIHRFHFSSVELGFFYGGAGGLYALSTGLLIRPFLNIFKAELLFFLGIAVTALTIFSLPFVPSSLWLWPIIFLMCFFVSFVTPTSITIVSNQASAELQGEALGILNAVNAASFMFSPLLSGSLVGAYPLMPMWLGGSVMLASSFLLLFIFRSHLIRNETNF